MITKSLVATLLAIAPCFAQMSRIMGIISDGLGVAVTEATSVHAYFTLSPLNPSNYKGSVQPVFQAVEHTGIKVHVVRAARISFTPTLN